MSSGNEIKRLGGLRNVLFVVTISICAIYDSLGCGMGVGPLFGALGAGTLPTALRVDREDELEHAQEKDEEPRSKRGHDWRV